MISAVLPGSFDPPTLGHLNLIDRSARLYDTLYIVIAVNRMKNYLFSDTERLEMMQELLKKYDNIIITTWDRLIVDFAKKHNIPVMIRGVRALADFGYEFELAMTNKQLYPELEIMFMPTDPKYFVLRSSAIKELASNGADISKMVPQMVAERLEKKLGN
ncbi:MAG: pantetheine-phosphate adenylyltransferase [Spirochaetia bacterium]|nr:pantetheine-phosphate adenylyltransferase [Spirochaetia bacterium]